ncbi:hypothetical protein EKO04_004021 [Ascochyta lentis]|uniref:Lectin n=1 Tax=Ascochyta lentis TaxID=205686 RepID=A0A8H7J6K6_9PLEO|nr:hypothetical protein EKO04_004021 [Ascochyta lentis]
MRIQLLAFPVFAACALCNLLVNNSSTKNDATPYYLRPDMGVDTAADLPVRRPPPPLPNRRSEPASDALWDKCRDKGCTLSWAMRTNDAEVGPVYSPQRDTAKSSFRSLDDLQTWGWNPFPADKVDEPFHDFYSTWGIGEALVDLGVSEYSDIYEGGENRLVFIDHKSFDAAAGSVDNQWYDVGGKHYRATGASYSFAINPKDGVIIGLNRLSPNYAAKDRTPPVPSDQMPALHQFSDVAWIGWDAMTGGDSDDIKNLRLFLSVGIVNVETRSVIRRALDAKGWELSPWPGHTFEQQWFETRAIIGTPNVQGFAYLLISHKDVLGNMFIDKVQVFQADTASRNPCIVMHLSKPTAQDSRQPQDGDRKIVEVVKVVEVHSLRAKL